MESSYTKKYCKIKPAAKQNRLRERRPKGKTKKCRKRHSTTADANTPLAGLPSPGANLGSFFGRFRKDFGSQMRPMLTPFWLQKSIKNQGRKEIDFWRIVENPGGRSGGTGGAHLKIEFGFDRHRKFVLHAATCTRRVLRWIEHAARNAAAAPLRRRSSLE